ncbi:hypothetical protein [Hyphomonas sp.]|uniref:hypothetical protein n=1 Tax=Hyphomonas sp. TaxID=87 RepID=UPI0025BE5BE7|nr:hypothetical protein [Hyphomonas sp.]
MEIPSIVLPNGQKLETISIPLPTADVPSYVPMVVPPSDLKEPEGTQPETTETTEQPAPSINIPMINIDVPLPTADTVVVPGYAAVSAVAVTTFAQPFFDTIKKKLQKFIQGKIDKWKKKRSLKDNQEVSQEN